MAFSLLPAPILQATAAVVPIQNAWITPNIRLTGLFVNPIAAIAKEEIDVLPTIIISTILNN
ncbi:MAG: hypothetical protein K0S55_989 [Clostridia bacterium]|nr:hypothetical protein [Clostridia bacterium]